MFDYVYMKTENGYEVEDISAWSTDIKHYDSEGNYLGKTRDHPTIEFETVFIPVEDGENVEPLTQAQMDNAEVF